MEIDSASLSALLELEALSPDDQTAFFSDALQVVDDDATPAAKAAHAIFRRAALAGLDTATLEAEMCSAGLSQTCAASAGHCWATQGEAARHALLLASTNIQRLVDLDWKFGGTCCSLATLRPSTRIVLVRTVSNRSDHPFTVSASSSEHAATGQTFVQLRLVVDGANGLEYVHMGASAACLPVTVSLSDHSAAHCISAPCHPPPCVSEMKLPRFYEFLMMLEEARAKLDLML